MAIGGCGGTLFGIWFGCAMYRAAVRMQNESNTLLRCMEDDLDRANRELYLARVKLLDRGASENITTADLRASCGAITIYEVRFTGEGGILNGHNN